MDDDDLDSISSYNYHHNRKYRKHRKRHQNNSLSSMSSYKYEAYQQVFLKYTFNANYEQINRIHATTKDKMKNGHLYFAKKPYPKR